LRQWPSSESCISTSVADPRFATGMTPDLELIDKLLTQAGMIMEDASVFAIINRGDLSARQRIITVRDAGRAAAMIAEAAEALLSHSS
jgi:hypothetical protein